MARLFVEDVSVSFPLYHGESRSLKKTVFAAASGRTHLRTAQPAGRCCAPRRVCCGGRRRPRLARHGAGTARWPSGPWCCAFSSDRSPRTNLRGARRRRRSVRSVTPPTPAQAWALSALGPGLDLALCEATFLSDREGTVQHLSAPSRRHRPRGRRRPPRHHPHRPRHRPGGRRNRGRGRFGGPVEVAGIGACYQL